MSAKHPATSFRNKPILVTGGSGFIGCHIADALAARGDRVLVLDNLGRPGAEEHARWLKERHGDRVAIEVGDIRDPATVESLVIQSGAVMHLAGQVAVTTSLDTPRDDFEINALGTINVLEAVRLRNPLAPVLFASTNKVYGRLLEDDAVAEDRDRYVPVETRLSGGVGEDARLDFHSPYGCSKGAADQYMRDYARVFGLRTAVLRMSCIYGPRQFGTEDQGWIAHFLLQAVQGRPITIYGNGLQVRDALHVSDAVAAWLAVLDGIDAVRGGVFNLGGGPGQTVSLLELIRLIGEMRGSAPQVRYADWRPGDQPWYVSDIRAIGDAVGWRPQIDLRDGLRTLDTWLETRFGRAAPAPEYAEMPA